MDNEFLGHELEEWYPMEPTKGPPLPRWLEIYWPWYKAPVPPPPPPPPPGMANLYGRVTNSATGQPLSTIVFLDNLSVLTDTDGNYQFLDLTPDAYSIVCSLSGYQPVQQTITLAEGNNLFNIALQPISPPPPEEGITISGTVFEDGRVPVPNVPLPGVTVTVRHFGTGDIYTAITDNNGSFLITGLGLYGASESDPVLFELILEKAGYYRTQQTIYPVQMLNPNPIPWLLLQRETAFLYGTVRDSTTGQPLAGVSVQLNSYSAQTGSGGNYEVSALSGDYLLTLSLAGYQTLTQLITLVAGDNWLTTDMTPEGVPPPTPLPIAWVEVTASFTNILVYTQQPEVGSKYLIDKIFVWVRVDPPNGNGVGFHGHVEAILHPYGPGAFCPDQFLPAIAGQDGWVNPVHGNWVTFYVPYAHGGILSVKVTDEYGRVTFETPPFDEETQYGISAPAKWQDVPGMAPYWYSCGGSRPY